MVPRTAIYYMEDDANGGAVEAARARNPTRERARGMSTRISGLPSDRCVTHDVPAGSSL